MARPRFREAAMPNQATLYYVHDPMCSWCYAFRPVWAQIQQQLPASIHVQTILGGLAPDTEQLMPQETRDYIQGQWHQVMRLVPGTIFNFDFWTQCQPRRATYPACRAVLLARQQSQAHESAMIQAIQNAYYQQARNPSDTDTLYALAQAIGLDADAFASALQGDATREALLAEIHFSRSMGANSFPSLFLQRGNVISAIPHHYTDAVPVLRAIEVGLIG